MGSEEPDANSQSGSDRRREAGELTRLRLRRAATELVVEGGLEALTVRAVSLAAGTNVAAVSYHFGSRDALVAAVVETLSEPVLANQTKALSTLEASDQPLTVAHWVRGWGAPLLDVALSSDRRDRQLGRLIGQALADPESSLGEVVRGVVAETDSRFVGGLRDTLPSVPEPELQLRLAAMVSIVAGIASGAFGSHLARAQPELQLRERVLDILISIAAGPGVPGFSPSVTSRD